MLNLLEARKAAEEKDRSLRDKTMSLSEAIKKFVHDGDTVALSGPNFTRLAMAAVREIIRQGKKDLTVAKTLASFDVELLLAASLVKKIIASWVSVGVIWGVSKVMRDRVESGKVEFEEWSNFGMNLRFKAGAMGVPFLPAFSMLGSDLIKQNNCRVITCPYTGLKLAAVPALFPDVAVIHAQRADKYGNVIIDGPTAADPDIAKSAKHVIVTVEEIVDTEEIRREADKTAIPFFMVDAVVWAPFGGHPYDCYGYYDMDFEHVSAYVNLIETKGVNAAQEYLQEYVYGVKDHFEYLAKIPLEKLFKKAQIAKAIRYGWE
jgi:glutaconate CoA-transferase subunit A